MQSALTWSKIMRPLLVRLGMIAAAIVVVVSCDAGVPTAPGSTRSGSTTGKDTVAPLVAFDTSKAPIPKMINVGDSLFVAVHAHDGDDGLKSISVVGYTVTGSVALGTYKQTVRYTAITVPSGGSFRAGLNDTTVLRYLKPATPVDSSLDSMVVRAYATDSTGNQDSTAVTVHIVAGPKVTITTPLNGDTAAVGQRLAFSAVATQTAGITGMSVRVRGDSTWPSTAKLDTTVTLSFSPAVARAVDSGSVVVPSTAPTGTHITVTANATDVNGAPGAAAPVIVVVGATNNSAPVVTETVPPRVEVTDSIGVSATAKQNIDTVGFILKDSTGAQLKRYAQVVATPATNVSLPLGLNLADSLQGRRLLVTAFAVNQSGIIGYSVTDTTLVVYGRTFALPRVGPVGDLVVDPANQNVFVSDMSHNRLEVWQNSTQRFDSLGIAVGSMPWGLAVEAQHPDTLLVANSGGTNLSRVFIGSSNPRLMAEDLAHRILTRNAYVFVVTEARDATTGKLSLTVKGPYLYSDRPQYVGQLANGVIFFSTRPTATAPQGTVRWIDPSQAVPDLHQVITYSSTTGDNNTFILVNTDSVFVRATLPSSGASDTLVIFDHTPGTTQPSDSARSDSGVVATVNAIRAVNGSDVGYITGVDISQTGLTDTTYVAESADHNWIAFGSGATGGTPGEIFMTDTAKFFSPVTTTQDLLNNASETVNGLAVDSVGSTIAAHGTQATYFANVEVPFHLRLQGEVQSSITGGGGVAFHPQAQVFVNGVFSGNANTRLAFVAAPAPNDTASGEIDIVDAAYYVNRGRLPIKGKLYGPLRAVMPFPTDGANVVLRIFGMTNYGMISIPVTSTDIQPVP